MLRTFNFTAITSGDLPTCFTVHGEILLTHENFTMTQFSENQTKQSDRAELRRKASLRYTYRASSIFYIRRRHILCHIS